MKIFFLIKQLKDQSLNTHTPHISEMMIGNPNNMVKDRSPMWKDFKDNRFDRPFMVLCFFKQNPQSIYRGHQKINFERNKSKIIYHFLIYLIKLSTEW